MGMTWDEAFGYVEETLDDWCAAHGVTARIQDPGILAGARELLRVRRRDADATRIEVPTAAVL